MKDLIAASRVFRERASLPRVVSRSFRKSSTSGASICSMVSWEGVSLRRSLAKVRSSWKASRRSRACSRSRHVRWAGVARRRL